MCQHKNIDSAVVYSILSLLQSAANLTTNYYHNREQVVLIIIWIMES